MKLTPFRLRAIGVALTLTHLPAAAVQVDSELIILVDVSSSMNRVEHNAVMDSLAVSFESGDVLDAVESRSLGTVAASLIFWAGHTQQAVGVDWMEVSDAASAAQFAAAIRSATRPFRGASAIGSALAYATAAFGTETGGVANGFESSRQAISIFGDGPDNNTPQRGDGENHVQMARDEAAAAGVDEISSIVLQHPVEDLESYYLENVILQQNGEVAEVTVIDFNGEPQDPVNLGIAQTIGATTVTSVPEPSSVLLGGLAIGAAALRRRRQEVCK
ncbi:MAG: DUF1194 domain-containing protein [Verrucomicrobiota bacterium]